MLDIPNEKNELVMAAHSTLEVPKLYPIVGLRKEMPGIALPPPIPLDLPKIGGKTKVSGAQASNISPSPPSQNPPLSTPEQGIATLQDAPQQDVFQVSQLKKNQFEAVYPEKWPAIVREHTTSNEYITVTCNEVSGSLPQNNKEKLNETATFPNIGVTEWLIRKLVGLHISQSENQKPLSLLHLALQQVITNNPPKPLTLSQLEFQNLRCIDPIQESSTCQKKDTKKFSCQRFFPAQNLKKNSPHSSKISNITPEYFDRVMIIYSDVLDKTQVRPAPLNITHTSEQVAALIPVLCTCTNLQLYYPVVECVEAKCTEVDITR